MIVEVSNTKSGDTVTYDGFRLSGSRRSVARASALSADRSPILGIDPERMGKIRADLDGDRETLIATLSHAVSPDAPYANWISVKIDGKDVDSVSVQETLQQIEQRVSPAAKSVIFVHAPETPTWSLIQTKVGVLGRTIGEAGNTVGDRVAAASGIIRDANGRFRCPDNTEFGGTFTDISGSTCGRRIVVNAIQGMAQEVAREVADIANGAEIPTGRQAGHTEAIRAKNREILERVAAAGGELFRPSKAYVDREEVKGTNGGWEIKSHADTVKEQEEAVSGLLDTMRTVITGGDPIGPYDFSGVAEFIRPSLEKTIEDRRKGYRDQVDQMSPELRELIRTSTNEELLAIMKQRSIDFSAEVSPNIRVSVPSGERLDSILSSGRYLTTHEARSDHSTSSSRKIYERQIGIPQEVADADRPASGYIVHPAWEQRALEHRNQVQQSVSGREATEFDTYIRRPFGNLEGYGDVDVILRPEVSERSGFGQGDSLRTHLRPMGFRETDPDVAFMAIVSANGADSDDRSSNALRLLDSHLSGSFERLNLQGEGNNPELDVMEKARYMEALIMGSFGLEDMAEVRVRQHNITTPFNVAYEARGKYATEQAQLLAEEFFSAENLKNLGFTDEEIEYIMGMLGAHSPEFDRMQYLSPNLMIPQLIDLIEFRNMNQRKEILDKAGVRLVAQNSQGTDPFDPSTYKDILPGETIEDLLKRKVQESLVTAVRQARREDSERVQRPPRA